MIETKRTIKAFTNKEVDIPDALQVVDQHRVLKEDERLFSVLTKEDGDKRIVWNRMSLPEINAAKKLFDDLVKEGMDPFRVGTDGKATSEKMTTFDASAEEVIFLPKKAIIGG